MILLELVIIKNPFLTSVNERTTNRTIKQKTSCGYPATIKASTEAFQHSSSKERFYIRDFYQKVNLFLPIHQDYHRKRDVRQRQFERRRAAGRFGHRRAHQPQQRIDFNPDKIKGG